VTGIRSAGRRFRRSLSAKELVEQCENIVTDRKLLLAKKPILFSCMGEGEPLLNYKNVVAALKKLAKDHPRVRLALSTSGIVPRAIRALAHEQFTVPFKLQISLHAPDDRLRRAIMPRSAPIKDVVAAAKYYKKISDRSVEWNYVLLAGVNDSQKCAQKLAALLGAGEHIKLNAFNGYSDAAFSGSRMAKISAFMRTVKNSGCSVEYYRTNGTDIAAACGQLKYGVAKKKKGR
jgi:23S rRNA (adenine2503-C2)-methyltransferase